MPDLSGSTIRRAFADLPFGQVHYRYAGSGRPLLLLHASPGGSKQLESLAVEMARTHRVISPDTPGNGDSARLPIAAPAITDYAAALPKLMDVLGIDKADVYGSHTGACIAAELAILAPDRIGRVVLDGVGLYPPALRDDLLARYAHPFTPDIEGAYLMRAFQFLRDQFMFFPWYERNRAHRRDAGLGTPAYLHAWLVELLKASETYPLAYRAAFAWDAANRLPLITRPSLLVASGDDPLHDDTVKAAALCPAGRFAAMPRGDDPQFVDRRTAMIVEFLGG
ncbi:MAG: alpha/beta hydrolase [Steroidobacteraceae bacterium]|nr:alpha/beta hydrolase [Steroidobacteraceae bacterium]